MLRIVVSFPILAFMAPIVTGFNWVADSKPCGFEPATYHSSVATWDELGSFLTPSAHLNQSEASSRIVAWVVAWPPFLAMCGMEAL